MRCSCIQCKTKIWEKPYSRDDRQIVLECIVHVFNAKRTPRKSHMAMMNVKSEALERSEITEVNHRLLYQTE